MRQNKKLNYIGIFFTLIPFTLVGQEKITRDSLSFINNDEIVNVAITNIKQYYNDSTCIWELESPKLSGLKDTAIQNQLNSLFESEVYLGDCQDAQCEQAKDMYKNMKKYWTRVKINHLKNDFLSFSIDEGCCPISSLNCYSEVRFQIVDISSNQVVDPNKIFIQDKAVQKTLDNLIISKLGYTPENMAIFREGRQFGLDRKGLLVFYDSYTLERNQASQVVLSFDELKDLIEPESPLHRLLN